MKSMSCKQLGRLSQRLIDGELDAARISAVRGHMRLCPPCAQRFDDIQAIVQAAQKLETLDPPPSLWAGIDSRLADEEVADSRRSRFWFWWQQVRRPAYVGGLLMATAGTAIVLATLTRPAPEPAKEQAKDTAALETLASPNEFALLDSVSVSAQSARALSSVESDYQTAIDELFVLVEDERKNWSPAALGVFERRMRAIDEILKRETQLARLSSDNPVAHDALHTGYREKVVLLQQAVLAHDQWQ